jgi:hypothetical protein
LALHCERPEKQRQFHIRPVRLSHYEALTGQSLSRPKEEKFASFEAEATANLAVASRGNDDPRRIVGARRFGARDFFFDERAPE